MVINPEALHTDSTESLSARFSRVRSQSVGLCWMLAAEDTVVQSMPDVSPTKWHLAHMTWFFERFVLLEHSKSYQCYDDAYDFLFNSYYYTAGQMHPRPQRGMLSRPTLDQVMSYRRHVDDKMRKLISERPGDKSLEFLVTLGLNHEQQHQELLLTDIKHVLWQNPLQPAMNPDLPNPPMSRAPPMGWMASKAGVCEIGATGRTFCFDNETPRHEALLGEHRVADRLVTNGEFREFITSGGYREASHWLSDGWAAVNKYGWQRPLYWNEDMDTEFTLGGNRRIDDDAPVCHVSFYEADAFARWAGCRLPTEFEWEHAANHRGVSGNLLESGYWHPAATTTCPQFYGDVWEWTSSAYAPYPGFKPLAGSLGEYNGKFMCNQMSVRGGSCVTSTEHIRSTYRSFFYPQQRWQFLGLRLAKDGVK